MNRRELIQLAATAAGLQAISHKAYSQVKVKENPFKLGIASGAPTPDGVVLWTKLLSDGWFSNSMGNAPINVRFEVANDEQFKSIALQGTAAALPQLGHAVHAELRGLEADRWYFYRFMLDDAVSAVGRTRTAPEANAIVKKMRFAFASCQRWEHGFYAAYVQMLADNPDLVVFLGDYIYEYATPKNVPAHFVRTHILRKAITLADYRDRYALHKSDPALQAMHAAAPWVMTWDDHEVDNDYAGAQSQDLQSHFLERRAAAYQAFYEHMPLPISQLKAGLASLGQPDAVRVTQRLTWGQLASFHLLDCRQFRDVQACSPEGRGGSRVVRASHCSEYIDPKRSMLGAAQEAWLDAGLARDVSSHNRWSVLAQSSMFSRMDSRADSDQGIWTDGWDGYPAARQRLTDSLLAKPSLHPVLIGGDVHYAAASTVKSNFDNTDSIRKAKNVATEFCGTSISSHGGFMPERIPHLLDKNPHLAYVNGEKRGYTRMDVTASTLTASLMGVDDPSKPDSATRPLTQFVVERGNKMPQRVRV